LRDDDGPPVLGERTQKAGGVCLERRHRLDFLPESHSTYYGTTDGPAWERVGTVSQANSERRDGSEVFVTAG